MPLNIRQIRERLRWTQEQLAANSGVSKRMIASYETEGGNITLKNLRKIASALGVSIYEIIEGESEDRQAMPPQDKKDELINQLTETIKFLEQNLRDKDKIIRLMEDRESTNKQTGS